MIEEYFVICKWKIFFDPRVADIFLTIQYNHCFTSHYKKEKLLAHPEILGFLPTIVLF